MIAQGLHELQYNTRDWPRRTQPWTGKRSLKRVKPATLVTYLKAINAFVLSISDMYHRGIFDGQIHCTADVEDLAAHYTEQLPDGDVRPFHSAFGFFFSWCDRTRLTAELKGVEKESKSTPTTPMTYAMVIALAVYARATLGLPQAVGVVVGFFGLLRANELVKVKAVDVVLRGVGACKMTTIRLLNTKSGREQSVQFAANSVPELMLICLLRMPTTTRYQPLFGFRSYSELYKLFTNFRLHFRITLHITPHSLRAGGATHLKVQGWSLVMIMEIGRWESMAIARSYVDFVFTILPECTRAEAQMAPTHEAALRPMMVDNFFT